MREGWKLTLGLKVHTRYGGQEMDSTETEKNGDFNTNNPHRLDKQEP